jgi:hypothetical protein
MHRRKSQCLCIKSYVGEMCQNSLEYAYPTGILDVRFLEGGLDPGSAQCQTVSGHSPHLIRHEEYSYFVICLPECPDYPPNGVDGAIAIYNPPHPFGWAGEESTIVLLL